MKHKKMLFTAEVIAKAAAYEFEDWRQAGEDIRNSLTYAVMSALSAPETWTMAGEYRAEFGGLFPVQVRFTPSHEHYCLVLCSPGELCPNWSMLMMQGPGTYVVQFMSLEHFDPTVIQHKLDLLASLDLEADVPELMLPIMNTEGGL